MSAGSSGSKSLWKTLLPSRRATRKSERGAIQVTKGAHGGGDNVSGAGGSLRGGKRFGKTSPPGAASAFEGWLAASYHSMSAVEAAQLKEELKHHAVDMQQQSPQSTQSTQSTQVLGAMGTGDVTGVGTHDPKNVNASRASIVSVSSFVSPSRSSRGSQSGGDRRGGGGVVNGASGSDENNSPDSNQSRWRSDGDGDGNAAAAARVNTHTEAAAAAAAREVALKTRELWALAAAGAAMPARASAAARAIRALSSAFVPGGEATAAAAAELVAVDLEVGWSRALKIINIFFSKKTFPPKYIYIT